MHINIYHLEAHSHSYVTELTGLYLNRLVLLATSLACPLSNNIHLKGRATEMPCPEN